MTKAKKNKLLDEVVAEATTVRDSAIESAKVLIAEAITPQLQDVFAGRLREEEELDDDPHRKEPTEYDQGTNTDDTYTESEEFGDEYDDEEDVDEADDIEFDDEEEIDVEESDDMEFDDEEEVEFEEADDFVDDEIEGEDDIDAEIEELLRELEPADDEEDFEDIPTESDEFDDEEEIDLDVEEDFGNWDIDEIYLVDEEEELDDDPHRKEPTEYDLGTNKDDTYEALNVKLTESREVNNYLLKELKNVNLFNSKLTFACKLLSEESFTKPQKLKIVESLDRAKTVDEVKLIYTSLMETYRTGRRKSKKTLSEGASKTVRKLGKSKEEKEVISEAGMDNLSNRFQVLAGIPKTK